MIITTKKINDRDVVDVEWLRAMSDENLQDRVTSIYDAMVDAQTIVLDMRDAMLGVLVKHDICPAHWHKDECPIEVYGKRHKLGSKYESDMKRLHKTNMKLREKVKKLQDALIQRASREK